MSWTSTFKKIFSSKPSSSNSSHTEIGNVDPFCPYCDIELDKMPGRKKKCPSCGKFIYVRTRPSDRQKILIREDQIETIETQWAKLLDNTRKQFPIEQDVFEAEKEELRKKFGCEPSEHDIRWSILNKELLINAQEFKWGLYRNTRLSMGNLLKFESKDLQALDTYLEVCYIDINGPFNCGTRNPDLLKRYPPFDQKWSFIAPAVIGYIVEIIDDYHLSQKQVAQRFVNAAEKIFKSLDLPVAPNHAWETFKVSIYGSQEKYRLNN